MWATTIQSFFCSTEELIFSPFLFNNCIVNYAIGTNNLCCSSINPMFIHRCFPFSHCPLVLIFRNIKLLLIKINHTIGTVKFTDTTECSPGIDFIRIKECTIIIEVFNFSVSKSPGFNFLYRFWKMQGGQFVTISFDEMGSMFIFRSMQIYSI